MLHAPSYMYKINDEIDQPAPEHAAQLLIAKYSNTTRVSKYARKLFPKKVASCGAKAWLVFCKHLLLLQSTCACNVVPDCEQL